MQNKLFIGDVFHHKSDGGYTHRILMADEIFLYSEILIKHEWLIIKNINSHIPFSGHGVEVFLANATWLRNEPYTTEQSLIIRPDLPLSLARRKDLTWKDLNLISDKELIKLLGKQYNQVLLCDQFYFYPKGPKGGRKLPKLVESSTKGSITFLELIRKAAEIQLKVTDQISDGMGLFRAGLKNKIPTYAIDDYYFGDSDIFRMHEIGFNWKEYFDRSKKLLNL